MVISICNIIILAHKEQQDILVNIKQHLQIFVASNPYQVRVKTGWNILAQ